MRVFVTGGTGFAGTWLCRHLESEGDQVVVYEGDINDGVAVLAGLHEVAPEAVYHLAGQANVAQSWTHPIETFRVNAEGTLQITQALVEYGKGASEMLLRLPTFLLVSSAEVYGTIPPDLVPVPESQPVAPVSPYAASKVAAEQVALQAFRAHGLPVIVARPFNHIGPGQAESFVVSALARRIVEAKRDGQHVVTLGNPDPRRDFTDVRDIAAAYRLLVLRGAPGTIYNISTGASMSIGALAQRMIELAGGQLTLHIDEVHRRAVDVPDLCGDSTALRTATGWSPAISLDQTLLDVMASVV